MGNIFNSRTPDSGIYTKGFKGKGMCSHCNFSQNYPQEEYQNQLYCNWYNSACKLVSRNCLGIMSLKLK